MARPPRSWRPRLLGSFRTGQDRPANLGNEPQRLVLYLPGSALDEAERQSIGAGAKDLQRYCETVLLRHIEAQQTRNRVRRLEAERGNLEGLRAVSSDPDYLAELSQLRFASSPAPPPRPAPDNPSPSSPERTGSHPFPLLLSVVERHAGLSPNSTDPSLAACLSTGSIPSSSSLAELASTLEALHNHFTSEPHLPRPAAFALHRLALVAQVFITGSWYASTPDPTLLSSLRWIQEAVDRILSGQEIRYDDPEMTASSGLD